MPFASILFLSLTLSFAYFILSPIISNFLSIIEAIVYPMDFEDRLIELTADIVKKIVVGYSPQKIILFGSLAYGTPTEESDIDLLIIKDTDKRPIERWMEVKRLLRDPNRIKSISPLVYTTQEIKERLAIKDFFIQEVLEKGKVLYG